MPCKPLRGMYLLNLVDHALYLCRANNPPHSKTTFSKLRYSDVVSSHSL